MNINFENDTVQAFNKELPLSLTRSGHYILPLSPATQLIQDVYPKSSQDSAQINLHVQELTVADQNHASIASKLQCQFAHESAQLKPLCLISGSGLPWDNSVVPIAQIHKIMNNCSILQPL